MESEHVGRNHMRDSDSMRGEGATEGEGKTILRQHGGFVGFL